MWLNCKVIKKWQPPHFYISPPFSDLSHLLAKNFISRPQVSQFLEGPTPSFIRGVATMMEWFLLQRFVDLVRIYFLLIVSRNHSNRVNIVLISGFRQIYTGCYPLHNIYFNDMQINRWQNFKDKMVPYLFTLNLLMTTKIRRISLLRTFFLFLWINLFCPIADVV